MNNNLLVAKEKKLYLEYPKALTIEESFLKQKSRVKWLNLWDNNNAFFFIGLLGQELIKITFFILKMMIVVW